MISLIVLAAGLSERFGRNKLLEKINGVTIIEKVVRSAVNSKADEVVIVLGYDAETIKNALEGKKCKFVFNENFMAGQSSSVKAGLKSVFDYAEAAMILPGDVAFITPKEINAVIDEFKKSKSPIVVPSYKGKLGHPILFDRSLFPQIANINEATKGLKDVVNRNQSLIKEVETSSDEILHDIDREDDLRKPSYENMKNRGYEHAK